MNLVVLVLPVKPEECPPLIVVVQLELPNNVPLKETMFVIPNVIPQPVSHVTLIVLNVLDLQIPVPFVLETESILKNVLAQKDIMMLVTPIVHLVPPNV